MPAHREVCVRTVCGQIRFLGEGGQPPGPAPSPLHADLEGCPPIYIQTGADETLLDDSRKLADLARKSGVEVTLEIVPEMKHVFQFRAGRARSGCCCGQS